MTIDSYLDSLREALAGRMPVSITDQRLRELETHLRMSAADHRNSGLDDAQAINLAIAELGAVEVVADGMVRQRLGFGPSSKWSFSRLAAPALFLGIAAPYGACNILAPVWPTTLAVQVVLCDMAAWIAILFVSIGVWRTRRWLVAPTLRWACPTGFVLAMVRLLIFPAGFHSPRDPAGKARLEAAQARFAAQTEAELNAADRWSSGHAPSDEGPMMTRMVRPTLVPLLPFVWKTPVQELVLQSLSPSEATKAWSLYGAQYVQELAPYRTAFASRKAAPLTPFQRLWSATTFMVPTMAIGVGLAFGLNGFVLVLAAVSDESKNRRMRRKLVLGG